jgi:hypothetical protein
MRKMFVAGALTERNTLVGVPTKATCDPARNATPECARALIWKSRASGSVRGKFRDPVTIILIGLQFGGSWLLLHCHLVLRALDLFGEG